MSAPTIRRMRWWDVASVVPLERLLFPDDAWTAETFWSELAQDRSRHYLVVTPPDEPERVVGYAGLIAVGGDGDVQTIGVEPSWQGRGLGAALLVELLDEAARRRCDDVLLEVRSDNPRAQELYRRNGFEQIAVRRRYYQPGDVDAVVMRLRHVSSRPAAG